MRESAKESQTPDIDGPIPSNLKQAISQHLMSLKAAGISQLPKSTGNYDFSQSIVTQPEAVPALSSAANTVKESPVKPVAHPPVSTPKPTEPSSASKATTRAELFPIAAAQAMYENLPTYGPEISHGDRPGQLQILQQQAAQCTKCNELASTRTQTVFGVGSPTARLAFIGEAPGADEDRLGEPFVGAAGQLLTKIIGAMKLSRNDVYILNTLKCRPPGNRNPKEDELHNCAHFAIKQLEIIQPDFICCLGSIAAKTLLNTKQSIGRMRGQFYKWRGSRVLVTYHPAYLLRSPDAKRHVWEDMQLIMQEMGLKS